MTVGFWLVLALYVLTALAPTEHHRELSAITLPTWLAIAYLVALLPHPINELGEFGRPLRGFLNKFYFGHDGLDAAIISPRKGVTDAVGAYAFSIIGVALAVKVHAAWILLPHGKDLADMAQHFYHLRTVRFRHERYDPQGPPDYGRWVAKFPRLGLSYFLTTLPAVAVVGAWLVYLGLFLDFRAGPWWLAAAAGASVIAVNFLRLEWKSSARGDWLVAH